MDPLKETTWKILLETNFSSDLDEEVCDDLEKVLNELSNKTGRDYRPLQKSFEAMYEITLPSEWRKCYGKQFWLKMLEELDLEI